MRAFLTFSLCLFFHNSFALGVDFKKSESTFSIWSPNHNNVELWIDGTILPMNRTIRPDGNNDIYSVTVRGNWELKPYYFILDGKQVRDPYARMIKPATDLGIIINPDKTQFAWNKRPVLKQREDAIIYEMHVRDFSISPNSGVRTKLKGKFLGLVEQGTTFEGVKTGIDHLKELGVTHIQLMPSYDFLSCSQKDPNYSGESCYNWGYDPENFNVPEERYSLTPYDYHNRIIEFKKMVNEFHKAGIRVIMDVVYNHTANFEGVGETLFSPISPLYFTPTDLSGTGNSINASIPMVSQFIQDSLDYWVREFNIDGFRFDLIGIFDYTQVGKWSNFLEAKYADRKLLLYGEPWNGYASDPLEAMRVRLGTVGKLHKQHIGVFNPRFRESIKGNNDSGEGGGFAFGGNNIDDIITGVLGSLVRDQSCRDIDMWDPQFAFDPEQTINYVSAHDNLSLRDKILSWAKTSNQSNPKYLERIQMFAGGIILTSQGIPFLHGGVELLRDKKGDTNSYKSSDNINQINWKWKKQHKNIFDYYKMVIQLRKQHPAFRLQTWQQIHQLSSVNKIGEHIFSVLLDGEHAGDSWRKILVIFNSGANQMIALPKGSWRVAMEKSQPHLADGREVLKTITVEGTAITILFQKQE